MKLYLVCGKRERESRLERLVCWDDVCHTYIYIYRLHEYLNVLSVQPTSTERMHIWIYVGIFIYMYI